MSIYLFFIGFSLAILCRYCIFITIHLFLLVFDLTALAALEIIVFIVFYQKSFVFINCLL